jgi:putative glycosyltransferase (TIGR04372 family)
VTQNLLIRARRKVGRIVRSSLGMTPSISDQAADPGHLLIREFDDPRISGALGPAQEFLRRIETAGELPYRHLWIRVGEGLLRLDGLAEAVRAFRHAYRIDATARFDFGQILLDWALAKRRPPEALLVVVEGLAAPTTLLAPDLRRELLRQLIHLRGEPRYAPVVAGLATFLDRPHLLDIGNAALADGDHPTALFAYETSIKAHPQDLLTRLQIGVTHYLAADYEAAERHFSIVDSLRASEQERWGVTELPVRLMHATWLQAVGHIACLDTYLKAERLGWLAPARTILPFDVRNPPAGWRLLPYFSQFMEVVGVADNPGETLDSMIFGDTKSTLAPEHRELRRIALMHYFWAGKDSDGRTRWFAPWGAAVQRAWKAQGRDALLSVEEKDYRSFRITMEQSFGLPRDAWFVLLHVREPGFKSDWEKIHGYTRNADIDTYDEAIDHIVSRGGWVVRGGDPSMRPISARPNVIDYATSTCRSPELDILLCATCKTFLGTNSGFSLVPPLFGKRCVLTNWSPIGTPNWYPDDIMIPKLVRSRATGAWLSFEEMFAGVGGWSQWTRDFQTDLEIVDNDRADICDAVREMLDEIDGMKKARPEDRNRIDRYEAIAVAAGSYPGGRIGAQFAERYATLLGESAGRDHVGAMEAHSSS